MTSQHVSCLVQGLVTQTLPRLAGSRAKDGMSGPTLEVGRRSSFSLGPPDMRVSVAQSAAGGLADRRHVGCWAAVGASGPVLAANHIGWQICRGDLSWTGHVSFRAYAATSAGRVSRARLPPPLARRGHQDRSRHRPESGVGHLHPGKEDHHEGHQVSPHRRRRLRRGPRHGEPGLGGRGEVPQRQCLGQQLGRARRLLRRARARQRQHRLHARRRRHGRLRVHQRRREAPAGRQQGDRQRRRQRRRQLRVEERPRPGEPLRRPDLGRRLHLPRRTAPRARRGLLHATSS